MDAVQASRLDSILDRPPGQARFEQLCRREDSVLPGGELGNRSVGPLSRSRGMFATYRGVNFPLAAHAAMMRGGVLHVGDAGYGGATAW